MVQLKNFDTIRRLKGLSLLVMYLTILALSAFHVHDCDDDFLCHDCIANVKHNAHFNQESVEDVDCVLCKIIHANYFSPEILIISAAVFLILFLATDSTRYVVSMRVALPNLRAPPAFTHCRL